MAWLGVGIYLRSYQQVSATFLVNYAFTDFTEIHLAGYPLSCYAFGLIHHSISTY